MEKKEGKKEKLVKKETISSLTNERCKVCKGCSFREEHYCDSLDGEIVISHRTEKVNTGDNIASIIETIELVNAKKRNLVLLSEALVDQNTREKAVEKNLHWKKEMEDQGVRIVKWNKRAGVMLVKS